MFLSEKQYLVNALIVQILLDKTLEPLSGTFCTWKLRVVGDLKSNFAGTIGSASFHTLERGHLKSE